MKREDIEKKILDGAFAVVYKYTLSGTRMNLIAKECHMAQSNLHYHFKSKNDLLIALLNYVQENFTEMRNTHLANAPHTLHDQIYGFFDQTAYVNLNEPAYGVVQQNYWSMGMRDDNIKTVLEQSYQRWRDHISIILNMYDPKLPQEKCDLVAQIMVSMLIGEGIQYPYCPPNHFNIENYSKACVEMIEMYLNHQHC